MRLVETLSISIHSDILQLRHVKLVAQEVKLMASDSIVVLAFIVQMGGSLEFALVEPLDQHLEPSRVVVREVQAVILAVDIPFF